MKLPVPIRMLKKAFPAFFSVAFEKRDFRCAPEIKRLAAHDFAGPSLARPSRLLRQVLQQPASELCVYLTFDDGPDPQWTPRILDSLAEAGMRATFFVVGSNARRYPDLIRRAAAEGHELANHTFDHRHPWTLSVAAARQQVRDCATTLGDILGYPPRFYRAPHGRNRTCMDEEAELCGATPVAWDLSAIDWGPFGAAPRIAARLRRVRPGDIVLMHDGRNRHNRPDELMRVLPGFLDDLQRRRMRSVSLGQEPEFHTEYAASAASIEAESANPESAWSFLGR